VLETFVLRLAAFGVLLLAIQKPEARAMTGGSG